MGLVDVERLISSPRSRSERPVSTKVSDFSTPPSFEGRQRDNPFVLLRLTLIRFGIVLSTMLPEQLLDQHAAGGYIVGVQFHRMLDHRGRSRNSQPDGFDSARESPCTRAPPHLHHVAPRSGLLSARSL